MTRPAYILTYREAADPARERNLRAVLTALAGLPFEVIVVEQDSSPRLRAPLPHPDLRHVFTYNPGPFNKAWGLNVGARLARSPLLVFADADVIVDRAALDEARRLLDGGLAVVKPYRRLIDLDDAESASYCAGGVLPSDLARRAAGREGVGERLVVAGGVLMIQRAAFLHLGQWDERFRGWGGEDDALSYRIERAQLAGVELDTAPALHLAHQRANADALPHYAANCALLQQTRSYSDAQLTRMAELARQLAGNPDKYRPDR